MFKRFGCRFEFKLQDLWVGVFWKRWTEQWVEPAGNYVNLCSSQRLDIWVCVVPCFPLHIVLRERPIKDGPVLFIDGQNILKEIASEKFAERVRSVSQN